MTALETIPLNLLNMQDKPGRYALYAVGVGLLGVALNLLLVVAFDMGAEGVLWASVVVGIVATIAAGWSCASCGAR